MRLRLNGIDVPCETLRSAVGPDTLVFESTVPRPDVALTFTSTYLGSPGSYTAVSHLRAASSGADKTWSRQLPPGQLTPAFSSDRCLLDHLAEMQATLIDLGHDVAIDLVRPGDPLRSL